MATLFLMLGYPGAGKTTTAKIISELTGAKHLSSDQLRFDMFNKPAFDQAEHDKLYQELDKQTYALLAGGNSVIYDANLNRLSHRQDKYNICKRTNAEPLIIWVQTPKALAKERAVHVERLHLIPKNETPEAMFDRISDIIEEPTSDEKFITIDGTNINNEVVKEKLGL